MRVRGGPGLRFSAVADRKHEVMVPRRRLELPRPCGHWHLKPARLPIPPPGRTALQLRPCARLVNRAAKALAVDFTSIRGGCNPDARSHEAGREIAGPMTGMPVRRSEEGYLKWDSGWTVRGLSRSMAVRGLSAATLCRRSRVPAAAFAWPCGALTWQAFLQPLGGVGQIHAVQANLRFPESVALAAEDADVLVNLVGILHETGKQKFSAVQAEGPRWVAHAAKRCRRAGAGACVGHWR